MAWPKGLRPVNCRSETATPAIIRSHGAATPAGADFHTARSESPDRTVGRAARARCHRLRACRHAHHRPIERIVATAAIDRGARVLNLLTRGGDAVMAALAHGAYADVAGHDRGPRDRPVTGAAVLVRLHVQGRLAERGHPVVTARAACHDALVIEPRRQPGERGVAVLAHGVAGNVCGAFAGRQDAVVATDAVAGHARVRGSLAGQPGRAAGLDRAGQTGAGSLRTESTAETHLPVRALRLRADD